MSLTAKQIDPIIRRALLEDAAAQDVTTRTLIPLRTPGRVRLIAREKLVLCGFPVFKKTFKLRETRIKVKSHFEEGVWVKPGAILAEVYGPARGILSAERVALNFLQRMSGVATLTRRYVEQLKGTRAKLLDTRKTSPGLRILEKYAVKMGGGQNHRFDLKTGVMIKDNHRGLMGSFAEAKQKLEDLPKNIPVVLEVESLEDLEEAIQLGFKHIQLDNMSRIQIQKAVQLAKGKCRLEATGGITLKNIKTIAATGVDYISVGALTHSAPAVDLSLELDF